QSEASSSCAAGFQITLNFIPVPGAQAARQVNSLLAHGYAAPVLPPRPAGSPKHGVTGCALLPGLPRDAEVDLVRLGAVPQSAVVQRPKANRVLAIPAVTSLRRA